MRAKKRFPLEMAQKITQISAEAEAGDTTLEEIAS
jgi:hypothetical protein